MKYNIAIDGPAGVGKSSVSKAISKIFNILHLDTGLMFRSISYLILDKKLNIYDANNINIFSKELAFLCANMEQKIIYSNVDITKHLKNDIITKFTSEISCIKYIREYLLNIQRNVALNFNTIMDGRDIGTVVLPNADLKIYLNADIIARTKRRYLELNHDKKIDFTILKKNIEIRDYKDKSRNIAPLQIAKDAIEIDTTNLNLNEVIQKISNLVNQNIFNIN